MLSRGGVAQWIARLTRNLDVVGSSPINRPVVSLSKKLYSYCLVLVVPGTDSSVISQSNLNKLRTLLKIDLNVK